MTSGKLSQNLSSANSGQLSKTRRERESKRLILILRLVYAVQAIAWLIILTNEIKPVVRNAGIASVLFSVFCIILIQRNHIRLPNMCAPLLLLISATYIMYGTAGIHSTVVVTLPLVILFAALLLDRIGAIIYSFLSLGAVAVLVAGAMSGSISTDIGTPDYYDIMNFAVMLGAIVAVIWVIIGNMKKDFMEASDNEDRYRLLAENVSDVIWTTDLDLQTTYVSPSSVELTGYTSEELIVLPMSDQMTPESFNQSLSILQHEIEQHEKGLRAADDTQTTEVELNRKDGSTIWVETRTKFLMDAGQKLSGVLGVSRDIAERKNAEKELRESDARASRQRKALAALMVPEIIDSNSMEQSLAALAEQASAALAVDRVGIWLIEKDGSEMHCIDQYQDSKGTHSEGSILYTKNYPRYWEGVRNNSRISADDARLDPVTSEFLEDLLIPHRINSMLDAGIQLEGELAGVLCFEHTGPKRHWHYDEQAFANTAGAIAAQIITNENRRVAEEALAESQKQLQHAQKMESLGTLAGGIAHDFNNILHGILGFTQIARERTTDDSDILTRCLQEIDAGGRRASDLVSQILTFSRKTELDREPLELQSVVKEALRFLRNSIPSSIQIESKIDQDCEQVLANSTQFHQVVTNLCTNGMHAMHDHAGILTVELSPYSGTEPRETLSGELRPGEYVELIVKDTGTGIEPQILERLLEPFYTTKETGKGTGLGLAMVHGIVKSLEGGLLIESVLAEGTTVRVLIPTFTEEEAIEKIMETDVEMAHMTGHVLVVDDDVAITGLVELALRSRGFTTDVYNDVETALDAVEEDAGKYELALLDYTMPQKTGVELARDIEQLNPNMPVILATGLLEESEFDQKMSPNIAEVIKKPYDLDQLVTAINRVV